MTEYKRLGRMINAKTKKQLAESLLCQLFCLHTNYLTALATTLFIRMSLTCPRGFHDIPTFRLSQIVGSTIAKRDGAFILCQVFISIDCLHILSHIPIKILLR